MRPLRRILCVEDDPDIGVVITRTLEAIGGFTVLLCASATEAIEKAAPFGPDLMLLDVMLPGMDGPSLLQALRAQPALAAKPVVFLTAKAEPAVVASLLSAGALDVVVKPFDPMTLPARLRQTWETTTGTAPDDTAGYAEPIEALHRNFVAGLPQRLSAIETALEALRSPGPDAEKLATLRRLVHSLAGAAGTFGLDRVGERAKQIESLIDERAGAGQFPDKGRLDRISALVCELHAITPGKR
jgi:CheY-like chemotaxis protein